METIKEVEIDLIQNYYDNAIYYLKPEEYERIIGLLDKDYGYLDVILNFKDYYKLKPLLDQATGKYIKYTMINDYLNYSMLRNANINDDKREYLFDGDYTKFMEADNLSFFLDVEEALKDKAKETEKQKVRIHYLLDEVKDIQLQKCINYLFVYRCGITMMGYTTNDLLSYYTTNNNIMQDVHDHRMVMTYKRENKLGGINYD